MQRQKQETERDGELGNFRLITIENAAFCPLDLLEVTVTNTHELTRRAVEEMRKNSRDLITI